MRALHLYLVQINETQTTNEDRYQKIPMFIINKHIRLDESISAPKNLMEKCILYININVQAIYRVTNTLCKYNMMLLCISCKQKWHTNTCIEYPVSSGYSIFYTYTKLLIIQNLKSMEHFKPIPFYNQHRCNGDGAKRNTNKLSANTNKTQILFPLYWHCDLCIVLRIWIQSIIDFVIKTLCANLWQWRW